MGSRAGRAQLVTTGDSASNAFFREFHDLQIAVNESPHDARLTVLQLAHELGLGETADLDACTTELRTRATAMDRRSLHVVIDVDIQLSGPATVDRPIGTAAPVRPPSTDNAPADPFDPARWAMSAEQAQRLISAPNAAALAVRVTARVEGTGPTAADERMAAGVAVALAQAGRIRMRMDAAAVVAPLLRERGTPLADRAGGRAGAESTALRADFRDALELLDGLAPRAAVEAQFALQIARRVRAAVLVHAEASDEALQKISTNARSTLTMEAPGGSHHGPISGS